LLTAVTPDPQDQTINPAGLRRDYCLAGLQRADLPDDPLDLFRQWFDQALRANLLEPNAMVLSSCLNGQPSSRTVLLKAFDQRGLVFFTNTQSRKASQLATNPQVSVLFPWYALERQLSIEGTAEPISTAESFDYFRSRPRGSQIGAWVSHQSQVIRSRSLLEAQWHAMTERFRQGQIPLPPSWGGYRVQPTRFEFWQGRPNRLHDRFCYRRPSNRQHSDNDSSWLIERLAP